MSDKRARILHLVLSLETGGLERMVTGLVELTDDSLFEVEVCCLDSEGPFAEELRHKGHHVFLFQRNQRHYDYILPLKLRNLFREKRIDILHMHSGTYHHGMYGAILARLPVRIYTEHGRPVPEKTIEVLEDRVLSRFASRVITVSTDLQQYLADSIRIPRNKIETIVNGVDLRIFRKRPKEIELLNRLDLGGSDIVIGTVGRLADVKDQQTLLQAFKRVLEAGHPAKLVIVGDGPLRQALEHLAGEISISQSTRFLGDRQDIAELLNLMDVFVLSSISEGTSMSLLEAMASRVPCVVTDVGGNSELIKDGQSGYLAPPSDPDRIAEKIMLALTEPERSTELTARALEIVRNHYSIGVTATKYQELYLSCLGDRRSPMSGVGRK
jgi:sugar transferase (PEP-CTERM/EpsH1 system associated)